MYGRYREGFCSWLRGWQPRLPYVLLGAGVSRDYFRYCGRLAALILGESGLGVIVFLVLHLVYGVDPAYSVLAGALVYLGVVLPLTLAAGIGLPFMLHRSRGAVVESKFLVFAVALSMILAGGAKVSEAFRELWEKFRSDLPEFSIELEYIYSNLRLGRSVEAVLEEAALITPSESLRSLFISLARASRAGIKPLTIVENASRIYIEGYSLQAERLTTGLSALFEVYIAVAILVPVILGVVSLLIALYPIQGISFTMIVFASTFIVVPVLSAAILVVADAMMAKLRL